VQDLTTGSVSRHLLKTTSFMLVTMVFQTLYFLVDLYWVGRLGKEAVYALCELETLDLYRLHRGFSTTDTEADGVVLPPPPPHRSRRRMRRSRGMRSRRRR